MGTATQRLTNGLVQRMIVALLVSPQTLAGTSLASLFVARPAFGRDQARHYAAKFEAGTKPYRLGGKLDASIEESHLLLRDGQGIVSSISLAQVIQLTYDEQTSHPGEKGEEEFYDSLWNSDDGLIGLGGLALAIGSVGLTAVSVPVPLVTSLIALKKHLVRVRWREGDEEFDVELGMKRSDAQHLLADLIRGTSAPLTDLRLERGGYAELKSLRGDLGEAATQAFTDIHEKGSRSWKVHYISSLDPSEEGLPLLLTISPEFITMSSAYRAERVAGVISVGEVVEFNHKKSYQPVDEPASSAIDCYVLRCPPDVPRQVLFDVYNNPEIHARNIIRIVWKSRGENQREVILSTGIRDPERMLRALEFATGKPSKEGPWANSVPSDLAQVAPAAQHPQRTEAVEAARRLLEDPDITGPHPAQQLSSAVRERAWAYAKYKGNQ